jgi:hypothetical protein
MWFCPTYQRPEGLLELAESWEKYQPGKKLIVRVWENDPRGSDYAKIAWPKSWEFYVSPAEHFTPAMNEFFSKYPEEDTYGFIADDIRLTSDGALEYLEGLAAPFFIAYPNDTIQRELLCTHYCIGGDLVRLLGWFSPPFLQHGYTDQVWKAIGSKTGLLRYAPHAIFYHKHFLVPGRGAEYDEGYKKIYSKDGYMTSEIVKRDAEVFAEYRKKALASDVALVKVALGRLENQIVKDAGYEPTIIIPEKIDVHSDPAQPILQTGDVHRGVGGRDSASGGDDPNREAGGVHWDGCADDAEAARSDGEAVEERPGLSQGGFPWELSKKVYKYPDAKVAISVPSNGEWESGTAMSVAMLITDFMRFGLPGLRTRTVHLNSTESSMLVSNRHAAVRTALAHGASHLLFVDSDMRFPPWALRRLLYHDVPVVAANCTKRSFPVSGTALDFDGKEVDSRGKKGLEKVRQVGAAFMLIRRDVLEALKPPMFLMEWVPDIGGYCGEDVYFCQLVQNAGFDVLIDHELSMYIGHIGKCTYGWGFVDHKIPDWIGAKADK